MSETAPVPEPAQRKTGNTLGILTIVVAILACLIGGACAGIGLSMSTAGVYADVMEGVSPGSVSPADRAAADQNSQIGGVLAIGGGVLYFGGALAALVMGIVGLARKPENRTLPIIGVVISALTLLTPCVLGALIFLLSAASVSR